MIRAPLLAVLRRLVAADGIHLCSRPKCWQHATHVGGLLRTTRRKEVQTQKLYLCAAHAHDFALRYRPEV